MSGSSKVVNTKDKPKKKKQQSSRVLFWSPECKYGVILDRVKEIDWKAVDDEKQLSKVNVFWIDVSTIHEHFRTIQPWQMINHFPGMPNIARKNRMGQNLNKLLKIFPKEYSYYPRTWILPGEMADFRNQFDNSGNTIGNKIYIIKPDAGCQGRGIYLTKTFEKVPLSENVVAQLYIKKPLLIDNFKFDLRLYCLVTSVKPLRVYLFHDGLVRMCTEEYVKPSKANLDQSCMHLTNYAVNKHNENFLQPDSDEGGEGSKRSLQWFMDWIREEHGDAKADWLWKRMGILCMRTLLSILPTLSREYDQHFKSFANVPVDLRKYTSGAAQGHAGSSSDAKGGRQAQSKGDGAGGNTETDDDNSGNEGGSSVEGGRSEKEKAPSAGANSTSNAASGETADNEGEGGGKYGEDGPQTRGSRCFEVLGYDIMIDQSLNAWLIEVNHLPSFGTDSALDRDIKERLMEQVFSVLPALPDDQQAYMLHHKAESEKRLNVQKRTNALLEKREREAKEKEARERPRPPLRPREPRKDPSASRPTDTDTSAAAAENNTAVKLDAAGARDEAARGANSSSGEAADDDSDHFDEECTPERLVEIKTILFDVYKKFSPEKLNKIDRLLAKYVSHEEEFLRFVFGKYNVSASAYKNGNFPNRNLGQPTIAEESLSPLTPLGPAEASLPAEEEGASPGGLDAASAEAGDIEADVTENGNDTADEAPDTYRAAEEYGEGEAEAEVEVEVGVESSNGNDSATARGPKVTGASTPVNRSQRETSKRASRSMSPPRSSSNNNNNNNNNNSNTTKGRSAWKNSEQEDALYKTEVLALHVPKDDEEWLLFETSRLTQFTRIFPLPKPPSASASASAAGGSSSGAYGAAAAETDATKAALEEVDVEEQPDEEDKEEERGRDAGAKILKVAAKSATYEDIIFQAFLHDKRQTMRLHCPLPNRAKVVDDSTSFLPPLDGPSSSRSSFSTIGSGKGAVGWKAPPKPVREGVVRQPTQNQSDAAKRLSQGLSVASQAARNSRYAQNVLNIPGAIASSGYSVVLDPTEYQQLTMPSSAGVAPGVPNGAYAPANLLPQQQPPGVAPNGYTPVYGGIYPTFNRDGKPEAMWPSTKASRLLEESRMNRMRLEAAKANSNAVVRQQVFYFDPNYRDQVSIGEGMTLIPPNQGAPGIAGGLLGGGAEQEAGLAGGGGGGGGGLEEGSVSTSQRRQVTGNPTGISTRPLMVAPNRGRVAPAPNVRYASTGNMNTATVGGAGTHAGGNHSQEELLRQLFPSWF